MAIPLLDELEVRVPNLLDHRERADRLSGVHALQPLGNIRVPRTVGTDLHSGPLQGSGPRLQGHVGAQGPTLGGEQQRVRPLTNYQSLQWLGAIPARSARPGSPSWSCDPAADSRGAGSHRAVLVRQVVWVQAHRPASRRAVRVVAAVREIRPLRLVAVVWAAVTVVAAVGPAGRVWPPMSAGPVARAWS